MSLLREQEFPVLDELTSAQETADQYGWNRQRTDEELRVFVENKLARAALQNIDNGNQSDFELAA